MIKKKFFNFIFKCWLLGNASRNGLVYIKGILYEILMFWKKDRAIASSKEVVLRNGKLYSNFEVKSNGNICLANSTYFQNGVGSKLRLSLEQSGGSKVLLSSFFLSRIVVDYDSQGARFLSPSRIANSELSTGTSLSIFPNLLIRNKIKINNAVLAIQRNSGLYSHFILEVLPSLYLWKDYIGAGQTIAINAPSFAGPLIRAIGFNNPILNVGYNSNLDCKNIRVLKLIPASYLHKKILIRISNLVRGALENKCSAGPQVVILARPSTENRRISNEDDVYKCIKKKYPVAEILYPGLLSIEHQFNKVKNAKIIFGQHGSQLTNILWSDCLMYLVEFQGEYPQVYQEKKIDKSFLNLCDCLGGTGIHVKSTPIISGDICSDQMVDIDELNKVLEILPNL